MENIALGVGSRGKYTTLLCLVLYLPLDLTPRIATALTSM